jgi:hypothetical protein
VTAEPPKAAPKQPKKSISFKEFDFSDGGQSIAKKNTKGGEGVMSHSELEAFGVYEDADPKTSCFSMGAVNQDDDTAHTTTATAESEEAYTRVTPSSNGNGISLSKRRKSRRLRLSMASRKSVGVVAGDATPGESSRRGKKTPRKTKRERKQQKIQAARLFNDAARGQRNRERQRAYEIRLQGSKERMHEDLEKSMDECTFNPFDEKPGNKGPRKKQPASSKPGWDNQLNTPAWEERLRVSLYGTGPCPIVGNIISRNTHLLPFDCILEPL